MSQDLERAERRAREILLGWSAFQGEPIVRQQFDTWVVKARWPESASETDNAVATGRSVEEACATLLAWRRKWLMDLQAEKEKAHEVPRPVSAGGGDRVLHGDADGAAAADPGAGERGLPGPVGREGAEEHQSSAANAASEPLDAQFSEPETPPEPPSDDVTGQAGTVIEGHKPAEPAAYGGTLIDDTRERLSEEVDAEARSRIEACDTVLRETPMSEINNARMMGNVTDAQAALEAAFYAAQSKRVAVAETAAKLKRALWEMPPDRLSTFKPGEASLWPT